MSLFRNKEVKLIIVTSFLTFLVFLSTFIFITYNWFNEINKKYINQNTALVGAIISNNPELEEEIVPIITKGNIEQYYTIGNNILDKYYYTENLSSIKNPVIKDSYSNFNLTIILLWGVFFIDLGRKTSWLHARGCKPITLIFGLVYIF